MAKNAVIWLGPVSLAQVPDAWLPNALLGAVPCTGDGQPTCGEIVDGLAVPKVVGLLGKAGLTQDRDNVVLGAFSAGGSAVKRLAMDSVDRARIKAVYLADAMYEGVPLSQDELPPFSEGFVRYALDAIGGSQLFIATSSASPNACQGGKAFCGTGIQAMHANMVEIEKRSGRKFEPDPHTFNSVTPRPHQAWKLGNVRFGEWPAVDHGDHVHRLVKQVWGSVMVPWYNAGGPPDFDPSKVPVLPSDEPGLVAIDGSPWFAFAGFLLGAGLGFGIMRIAARRRR